MKFSVVFLSLLMLGATLHAEPAEEYGEMQIRTVLFPCRQAVLASEVEGTIRQNCFLEGERFQQNDLLLELDDSSFRQKLARAKAALDEAVSGENFTKKNLERTENLVRKSFQGTQDLERAQLDYDVAKTRKESADANLKLAELDLTNCQIKAPFPGRVVKRLAQEHEYIKPGQPVLQIFDDNQLLAAMHLPSALRNKIKRGQKLTIRIDEIESDRTGEISEIAGEIDSGSRTFEIKVLLDNKDGLLSSGMSGYLQTEVR